MLDRASSPAAVARAAEPPGGDGDPLYVDTHCHLSSLEGLDPAAVVERAVQAGVELMVDVGVDLASSAECLATASRCRQVHAAVGIHPHNAIEATDHVLRHLRRMAGHPGVVAIGETGLDYFRDHSPRVRQRESFIEHARIAKELDKALVVHARDAHDDALSLLDEEGPPARTVMHCFSGGALVAKACAERGLYVSFAGNVTFTNAPALREAAAAVPLELLVTETDSPYLSPHPLRGQPNEPARVVLVAEALARVHGVAVEELAAATRTNARRLFALGDSDEREPGAA
ncbi:MAG: TatD family hydrolase [Actinomycetota bacterium]|nr:TatD family hydrolase [Actinomycetota bacterium]